MTEPTATGAETERSVTLTRVATGVYEAVNPRGGSIRVGTGEAADFSPVELLLVAICGCTAVDVDYITARRAEPQRFSVAGRADKVRDEQGNRLENVVVTFDVTFPDGEHGDDARAMLPRAVRQSHDRLCTVSRTIEVGTPVEVVIA